MNTCLDCSKTISDKGLRCLSCSKKGKNHPLYGTHHPPEMIKKMSLVKMGSNNPRWLGSKVGYDGLHDWVRRRKPKPMLCVHCNLRPSLDLANISQQYKRDLGDWEYLCRKCHMESDGRYKNLKRPCKTNIIRNCLWCKTSFRVLPSYIKRGGGKFCSCSCSAYFHHRSK